MITRFIFLLLLSVSIRAQTIEKELQSSDFKCISNNAGDEYLSVDIKKPTPFSFLFKNDLCQLISAEIVSETENFTKRGYLLKDGILRSLELNDDYSVLIPQKVFYNPKYSTIAIIEFYMYSHIATSAYRYAVFSFKDDGNIIYDQLDFNEHQKIESVYKACIKPGRMAKELVDFSKAD